MLISIEEIAPSVRLGLWRIETDAALSPRENERRAVRRLIAAMLGHDDFEIDHEQSGKPVLRTSVPLQITISHTRGFAAVMLAESGRIGVDIEYLSDRVGRIAHRFMREDELAALPEQPQERLKEQLVAWCVKEAVYKYFAEDKLTFEEMRVNQLKADGGTAENLKNPQKVDYVVRMTNDYLLAYVCPK